MPRRVRVFPQVALALTVTVGFAVVTSASGPPQFITFPILTHVAEAGLDHGHFVFGGEAAVPTPWREISARRRTTRRRVSKANAHGLWSGDGGSCARRLTAA
jgi:hypothetical protein